MSGAPRVSDELLADLVDVLRGRAEVSRAFIAEEAGLRPTLTLELDRAPDEPAAYRELLQELFAEIAGGLGEHAHALSFAAGPPEAVAEAARGARVLYETGCAVVTGARHLYVHLPFCASRCGYCDFVTVVGHGNLHGAYVDAVLAELELSRGLLAPELETIFLGGGTPTLTERSALRHLLESLPPAAEVTVEANPETVTPELARMLRRAGVNRVSLGAQTFDSRLLGVLERRAQPDDVRRAVHHLRDARFDNVSLDLIYGIPGQSASDLERDLDAALGLEPEHLSCYELEAKPGTRFTHAHGAELARQAEAMEGYFEQVVERLTGAGYRWYETANFCRADPGRDLRAQHNLAYWLGRDYLGIGLGAVSTIENERWRTTPKLPAYLAALRSGEPPQRALEPLDADVRARERVLLGLRLDEPLPVAGLEEALDEDGLARMELLGLARRTQAGALTLTERGRYLGGGVTVELLAG